MKEHIEKALFNGSQDIMFNSFFASKTCNLTARQKSLAAFSRHPFKKSK